jgi:hypothetical protein
MTPAVAVSEPQSLPANRFINSLDEMTKTQERRLISLQYHVPNAVVLMLLGVAMIAIGLTGYHAGLTQTVAVVIVLVIDLDQPARGLIRVPTHALVTVAPGILP